MRALAALGGLLALAACGGGDGATYERSAIERGRALFSSPALSRNSFNELACSSCHAVSLDDPRLLPGAPMPGVVLRPSYWGGDETDLLESLNQCLSGFMLETRGLARDDAKAVDLYAYLESLPPDLPEAVPFDPVRELGEVPPGDAARGEPLYAAACGWCHGALHTGEGRGIALAVVVPEETLAEHADDPTYDLRAVFVEKIRHGRYLGFGGIMPPFSREVLSDQDVGDLLAYLGQ
ncbi:MAG TPA: c-type cytochrome [Polyangiaceae bacterium]|nr:c-type cytochrome [Polyangiaceae bacterium]